MKTKTHGVLITEVQTSTDRSIVLDEYRFLEEGGQHRHQLFDNGEWKDLTGVSSVVKDIVNYGQAAYYGSRRALMELGYDPKLTPKDLGGIKAFMQSLLEDKELEAVLKKAYKAHSTYATARAEKGTKSHDIIDKWIKECIATNNGYPLASKEPKVQAFIKMTAEYNPRFIASEKHGYNKDLWIGGITDQIVETTLGLGIWDLKDRAYIGDKDLIQMGGYACLFPMEFTHVLGIPLEGEAPVVFYDVEKLRSLFIAQLEIYKFVQSRKPKYD